MGKEKRIHINRKRRIVKAIIYEGVALLLAFIFFWLWFGSLFQAILANIVFWLIKIGLYYLNECFWERIKWGKNTMGIKSSTR